MTLKRKVRLKKSVRSFLNKTLLSIIIFLSLSILIKQNADIKPLIENKVYTESLQFIKLRNIYNDSFGKIIDFNTIFKEEQVFKENISYKELTKYQDGVSLTVSTNYMVPSINSGIVVFIGEKEGYGKTIIVEQTDGIDVFYGNIEEANVNIYDYIEKGSLIGITKEDKLYLVFSKQGTIVDYKEVL